MGVIEFNKRMIKATEKLFLTFFYTGKKTIKELEEDLQTMNKLERYEVSQAIQNVINKIRK